MGRMFSVAAGLAAMLCLAAGAGDKNLIPGDTSFETGHGPFEKVGVIDESSGYDAGRSLRLEGGRGLRTPKVFNLKPDVPYFYSVYMKSETPGAAVDLMAYRSNWKGKNIVKTFQLTNEWKRYVLEIPPQKAGDWNNFWLYITPKKQAKECHVNADACQLEEGALTDYKPSEKTSMVCGVVCPVEGNVFYPDEPVKIVVRIFNSSDKAETARGGLAIEDYYGKVVKNESFQADIKGKSVFEKTLELKGLEKKGFYHVEAKASSEGAGGQVMNASFCVVDRPSGKKTGRAAILGASGPPPRRLDVCERIGVNWVCAELRWTLESKRGVYDEAYLARFVETVDKIRSKGMNAAAFTRRTPTWASEYPDPSVIDTFPPKEEYVEDYGRFVHDMVARFKDKIKVWQCWGGEVDGLRNHVREILGKDEDWFVERYAKLIEAGYKGAKKADSDCVWTACSVSGVDCDPYCNFQLSRKIMKKASKHMDEFVVHPYCWPHSFGEGQRVQSPEEHKLQDIYKTATELSGLPLWNGEYGFAIYMNEPMNGKPSKRRADYMARSILLTAASPNVRRIQYYAFWPDGSEGKATYDQWFWPNPLPTVAAYAATSRFLNGADKPVELKVNERVKMFTFEREDGGSLATVWAPGDQPIKMTFKGRGDRKFYDVMGNEMTVSDSVELGGSPIYVVSSQKALAMAEFLGSATLDVAPVEAELKLKNDKNISVWIKNIQAKNINGEIELKLPVAGKGETVLKQKINAALRPGVSELVGVDIPGGIDIAKLKTTPVEGKITTDAGTLSFKRPVGVELCQYFAKKPELDGGLDDWKGRPFISLDSSNIYPPDAIAHNTWTGASDLGAKVWTGWDEKYFYFAAEVTDDKHLNNSEESNIWSGDSIQMAFDTENNALSYEIPAYGKDDRDFAFGLNEAAGKSFFHQYWPTPSKKPNGVLCAIKRAGTITSYEIAIPFEALSIKPVEGGAFGFSFAIFDADSQSEGRAKIDLWMHLTPGVAGGKNPALYKSFILTK